LVEMKSYPLFAWTGLELWTFPSLNYPVARITGFWAVISSTVDLYNDFLSWNFISPYNFFKVDSLGFPLTRKIMLCGNSDSFIPYVTLKSGSFFFTLPNAFSRTSWTVSVRSVKNGQLCLNLGFRMKTFRLWPLSIIIVWIFFLGAFWGWGSSFLCLVKCLSWKNIGFLS
jgi:hypothetical protein